MLYNLSEKIKRLSSPKILLALAFFFIIMYMLSSGQPYGAAGFNDKFPGLTPLDMRDSYTAKEVCDFMAQLGDSGRVCYAKMLLIVDFAFPLSYTLFWSAALAFLLGKLLPCNSKLMYISLIPFVAGLADWFENILLLSILFSYPKVTGVTATLADMLTGIKGLFMWISLLLIAVGLLLYLVRLAAKLIRR